MATLTPELIISLTNQTGFKARFEVQAYIHADWVITNWSSPQNLRQQKALDAAVQLLEQGYSTRNIVTDMRIALAGIVGADVDDQNFDQDKLEARVSDFFEKRIARIRVGDDVLQPVVR